MTIWGPFVFAKPLGKAVLTLRDQQSEESMPAMNRLIQTLDEYLLATDPKARDVFRKAIGRPVHGNIPVDWPAGNHLDGTLSDEEILSLFASASSDAPVDDATREVLCRFARLVEAKVKLAE